MNAVKNFFRASAEDFKKIPGSPVAYWVSENMVNVFSYEKSLSELGQTTKGIITGDNGRFMRNWWEVSLCSVGFGVKSVEVCKACLKKWFPCNKGGEFRKWYGNNEFVINWENDGYEVLNPLPTETRHCQNYYQWCKFQPCVSWTSISSSKPSFRYKTCDLVDNAGMAYFMKDKETLKGVLGFCNSKVAITVLNVLAPTLNFNAGEIGKLPIKIEAMREIDFSDGCIQYGKKDWDSYETSWDFKVNPLVEKGCNLVNPVNPVENLSVLYSELRQQWVDNTTEMRRLETENNRIFIEAYGLQDELTPEVPWNEITLTCNPWYRYGVKIEENCTQELGRSSEMPMDEALEARLKSDTVKELISYAVGCMMGRYSLSKPGLILANQGSTIDDFWAQHQTLNSELSTPNLNFSPDADGIIPILDDDSFADDIVTQFHRFLRAAFGERNFNENLNFIEDALGKDIRAYFVKDFYPEHLTCYQKRPIYWLFSSPKGTFSALVYMHRYNSGTVGQVLGYLRSHITKIEARVDAADRTTADAAATQGMKSRAIKERAKLVRQLKELEDYEREIMHPLASKRIEIDLDDGVKVNYPKFGEALRKIPGMKKED